MAAWLTSQWQWVLRRWANLGGLRSDAVVYALAALFSVATAIASSDPAQWRWGIVSLPTYGGCALAAYLGRHRAASWRWRVNIAIVATCGAVLLPLVFLVAQGYLQPEVTVISRSANLIAQGVSPYHSYWAHGHMINPVHHQPAYYAFFPYFPLMGIFGLPAAVAGGFHKYADVRVIITLVTLAVMAWSLVALRARATHKLRVAQFLVILPSGALFLATGGDDLPILALSLLGVVGLQRRQVVVSGVAFGLAVAMKFTAWPLALGALLVARDHRDRRAVGRLVAWYAFIGGGSIAPFILLTPHAFFANVVAFPLGLAHVASPAASPLPGHILTEVSPLLGHAVAGIVTISFAVYVERRLRNQWPLSLASLLRWMAVGATLIIMTASATRGGYLIYPLNFWLWSYVIQQSDQTECAGSPTAVALLRG